MINGNGNRKYSEPAMRFNNMGSKSLEDHEQGLPLNPLGQRPLNNRRRKRHTLDQITTRNISKFLHGSRFAKNRRISLASIEGDSYTPFGEAIRVGNTSRYDPFARFTFDVTVERMKEGPLEAKRKSQAGIDVADGGIMTDSQKASLDISALHLAIIAQQQEVVELLLTTAMALDQFGEEFLCRMLASKVKVHFQEDIRVYSKIDQGLQDMNAFHIAARYHPLSLLTIIQTLRRDPCPSDALLDVAKEKSSHLKESPLHVAAKNINPLATRALLEFEADIGSLDARGFTPLHIAAKVGSEANTLALLEYGADPNVCGSEPNYNKTPLHRARSPKIVQILLAGGADPCITMTNSQKNQVDNKEREELSAFEVLLERNPNAAREMLNSGIDYNNQDLSSSDLLLVYDLTLFRHEAKVSAGGVENGEEMAAHGKMVLVKLRDLLKNPLAETFLHLKWSMTKKFFYANLFFYFVFTAILTALTVMATNVMMDCQKREHRSNQTFELDLGHCLEVVNNSKMIAFWVLFGLNNVLLFLLLMREILQAIHSWSRYVKEKENYLELLLISCTLTYVTVMFFNSTVAQHFGAASVFLAWIDMTLLIGRLPAVGIYIYMAVHVMKLLLIILLVYSTSLLAFAFAFHLLMPSHIAFDNPVTATLKVLVMMIGEFDFDDNFTWHGIKESGHSNGSSQILFVVFLFLASITIANLIVGLTVSKTEEIFKEAGVIRLEKTVLQVMGLEDVLTQRNLSFAAYLPKSWRKSFFRSTQVFPYLDSVKNGAEKTANERNKICVKPLELERKNLFMKDRDVLTSSLFGMYEDREYPIYLFDEDKCQRGKKLNITLPGWIVQKTLEALKEREPNGGLTFSEEVSILDYYCDPMPPPGFRFWTRRNRPPYSGNPVRKSSTITSTKEVEPDGKGREIRDSKHFESRRGTPPSASLSRSIPFIDEEGSTENPPEDHGQ